VLLALIGTTARGATYSVDSTADEVDAAPGDGACATLAGACTLRAAVQEANASPGADEIVVPSGRYVLSIPGPDEDAAATGDLDVLDALTITGAGAAWTILDAAGLDRHVEILASVAVSVDGVTFTGGSVPLGRGGAIGVPFTSEFFPDLRIASCVFAGNGARIGGAVSTWNRLTVIDCAFDRNVATIGVSAIECDEWRPGGSSLIVERSTFTENEGGCCGAISGEADGIVIRGCLFSGNRATMSSGGALSVAGGTIESPARSTCVVEDTTFSDNHAIDSGGAIKAYSYNRELILRRVTIQGCTAGGNGGAISYGNQRYGGDPDPLLVISDSVLHGNVAGGSGGALFLNPDDFPPAQVRNTTISGNSAARGGAIALQKNPGSEDWWMDVISSTIAFNAAPVADGIDVPSGALVHFDRSILAGSIGGSDCAGEIQSGGYNVFGSASPCTIIPGPGTDDLFGVDPLLGSLQDNGGPTWTHALLPGSPAIDHDDWCRDESALPIDHDQRGSPRPIDGDGDTVPRCDSGAFESCGPDADGDTLGDACDCAQADPGAMRLPIEPFINLAKDAATGDAILAWPDIVTAAGRGTICEVARDAIGALHRRRVADAPCVASGMLPPWTDARPVTDIGWYYLVRGVNACGPAPGQGWGRDSLGTERPACP
jgi:CSLREA domain-containing protein